MATTTPPQRARSESDSETPLTKREARKERAAALEEREGSALLRSLFGLPRRSKLVDDFGCALGSLSQHGRLYLTRTCICFYSSLFNSDVKKVLQFSEIEVLKKSRVGFIIPSMEVHMKDGSVEVFAHFFATSFDPCFQLTVSLLHAYRCGRHRSDSSRSGEGKPPRDDHSPARRRSGSASDSILASSRDGDSTGRSRASTVTTTPRSKGSSGSGSNLAAAAIAAAAVKATLGQAEDSSVVNAVVQPPPAGAEPEEAGAGQAQQATASAMTTSPALSSRSSTASPAPAAGAGMGAGAGAGDSDAESPRPQLHEEVARPPPPADLYSKYAAMTQMVEGDLDITPAGFFAYFIADAARFSLLEFHRKVGNSELSMTPWEQKGDVLKRAIQFRQPLEPHFLAPKSTRVTKMQQVVWYEGDIIVWDSSSISHDVPYGDHFSYDDRTIITPNDDGGCHVKLAACCTFIKSTIFKSKIIDSAARGGRKTYVQYLPMLRQVIEEHPPKQAVPVAEGSEVVDLQQAVHLSRRELMTAYATLFEAHKLQQATTKQQLGAKDRRVAQVQEELKVLRDKAEHANQQATGYRAWLLPIANVVVVVIFLIVATSWITGLFEHRGSSEHVEVGGAEVLEGGSGGVGAAAEGLGVLSADQAKAVQRIVDGRIRGLLQALGKGEL